MMACVIFALLLFAAADSHLRGAGLGVEKRRELLETMSVVGGDNESKRSSHGDLWSVSSATAYDHTCRQDVVQFQAAGTLFDSGGAGANSTSALASALAARLDAALGAVEPLGSLGARWIGLMLPPADMVEVCPHQRETIYENGWLMFRENEDGWVYRELGFVGSNRTSHMTLEQPKVAQVLGVLDSVHRRRVFVGTEAVYTHDVQHAAVHEVHFDIMRREELVEARRLMLRGRGVAREARTLADERTEEREGADVEVIVAVGGVMVKGGVDGGPAVSSEGGTRAKARADKEDDENTSDRVVARSPRSPRSSASSLRPTPFALPSSPKAALTASSASSASSAPSSANLSSRVPPQSRASPPPSLAPPSVYVLVLESVTRSQFMAYCPKTRAFLKRLSAGHGHETSQNSSAADTSNATSNDATLTHQAFVFAGFHTPDRGSTAAALTPALSGHRYNYNGRGHGTDCKAGVKTIPRNAWLPAIAQKHGYVTAHATSVNSAKSPLGGCYHAAGYDLRDLFDHTMPAGGYYGMLDVTHHLNTEGAPICRRPPRGSATHSWSTDRVKCQGGKLCHDHTMDYAATFWETYPDLPKMMHTHLYEPHDDEQLVSILDDALAGHIERILHADPRTIIIMMGDHGRPGLAHEHLPLVTAIVPSAMIHESKTRGHDVPRHTQQGIVVANLNAIVGNQQRLLSHFDLYTTLREVITGVGGGASVSDGEGASPSPILPTDHAPVNFFTTSVNISRGCKEGGIDPFHCSCDKWSRISIGGPTDDVSSEAGYGYQLGLALAKYLLQKTSTSYQHFGHACDLPLTLHRLERFMFRRVGSKHALVDLSFSVTQGTGFPMFKARIVTKFDEARQLPGTHIDLSYQKVPLIHLQQTSKYRRYEHCTPVGIPSHYCFC